MGLPSEHRLKRRSDFQRVYQQGIRRHSRSFVIRALPIISNPINRSIKTRIGISISRKVSKKAVVRNRIKRLIRAVFLKLLPRISPNWLIIVSVKPEIQECKYDHFLQELEELFIKTGIIYGN